ncbi:uncharacterized protein LOC144151963 [Haemaphysalis longicornis]
MSEEVESTGSRTRSPSPRAVQHRRADEDSEDEYAKLSPFSDGIMAVIGSQNRPHICYKYPITPVYIRLPKPIRELGDIYMQMVIPVDFKRVNWEFTQSSDRHHVWNSTEITELSRHIRIVFQDLNDGNEDKYEWHNSDVGSVAPVFKRHAEHFMQFHYDKDEKQLVTMVNGREYNRHDMDEGGIANEFTLYGTVFIPELVIPYQFGEMPFTLNLNGAVAYNDTYTIKFKVKPDGEKVKLNFGEIEFTLKFADHAEVMNRSQHEEIQVSSHSSCAFVSLNRKMVDQSMRRLVTPVMIIDGDIDIHSIQVGKG